MGHVVGGRGAVRRDGRARASTTRRSRSPGARAVVARGGAQLRLRRRRRPRPAASRCPAATGCTRRCATPPPARWPRRSAGRRRRPSRRRRCSSTPTSVTHDVGARRTAAVDDARDAGRAAGRGARGRPRHEPDLADVSRGRSPSACGPAAPPTAAAVRDLAGVAGAGGARRGSRTTSRSARAASASGSSSRWRPRSTLDAVLLLPDAWGDDAPGVLVTVDEGGKGEALAGPAAAAARERGLAVLAPDLRGTGESAASEFELATAVVAARPRPAGGARRTTCGRASGSCPSATRPASSSTRPDRSCTAAAPSGSWRCSRRSLDGDVAGADRHRPRGVARGPARGAPGRVADGVRLPRARGVRPPRPRPDRRAAAARDRSRRATRRRCRPAAGGARGVTADRARGGGRRLRVRAGRRAAASSGRS